jgi:hypothetical protein
MTSAWKTTKDALDEYKDVDETFLDAVFAKNVKIYYSEVGSDSAQAFLVDGDSLVLDLLSHPRLDYSNGGQLLQLVYLLEVRVNQLLEGQRNFQVLFFDALRGMWKNPVHLLAREVVIMHLEGIRSIKVHYLKNWWCPEFAALITRVEPSFAFVSRGKASKSVLSELRSPDFLYKSLIYHFLLNAIIVVRSSEAEFKSHAMYGFHLNFNFAEKTRKYFASRSLYSTDAILPEETSLPSFNQEVLKSLQGALPDEPAPHPSWVPEEEDTKSTTTGAAASRQSLSPSPTPSKPSPKKGGKKKGKGKGKGKGKKGKEVREFVPGQPFAASADTKTAQASQSDSKKKVQHAKTNFPSWKSSPRVALAYGIAVALQKNSDEASLEAAKVLLVHAEMLNTLNIRERAQVNERDSTTDVSPLLNFVEYVSGAMTSLIRNGQSLEWDFFMCDAIDGRLAHRIHELLLCGTEVPPAASKRLNSVWQTVCKAAGKTTTAFGKVLAKAGSGPSKKLAPSPLPSPTIARMDVPLLRHLASGVDAAMEKVGLLVNDSVDVKDQDKWFEDHRWVQWKEGLFEDGLKLEPEIKAAAWTKKQMRFQRVKKEKLKKWMENDASRSQHRYQHYMEKYAQSLKGGKIVMRDVVIAAEDQSSGKKKKNRVSGRAAQIRAENDEKMRQASLEKVQRIMKMASGQKTLEARIAYLDDGINSLTEPLSAVPGHMKLLEWCCRAWEAGKEKGKVNYAVRIWQLVNDVFRRFKADLSPEQMITLQEYLFNLGFEDAARKMVDVYLKLDLPWKEFSLSKQEIRVKSATTRNYEVGMSCARFQMRYAGPVMMRNVESAPDDRVSGFFPDKWQRDLLDIVDQKDSALVCAPTSSGKTFISYYAMKQVLLDNKKITRNTDKGIIVYVSPTKALVNQISADVYQRYGPVYGVFTPDYAVRALECDVLITVPECLELMLLSPQREQWHRQIRYVIIDEIHTIGGTDGAILQHVLLLLRAPYIALSATVGNPRHFFKWLESINEVRGGRVHLITFSERWSDLNKAMYLPTTKAQDPRAKPIALQTPDPKDHLSLVTIPPCAALGGQFGLNEEDGFPEDLDFAPQDTLQLWDRMDRRARKMDLPEHLRKGLDDLNPDIYFKDVLCIDKKMARQYEIANKNLLVDWVKAGLHEDVDAIVQSFYKEHLEGRLDTLKKTEGVNLYKES